MVLSCCAIVVLVTLDLYTASGFLITDPLYRCPVGLPRNTYLKIYGNYCYQFILDREEYWHPARKDCQRRHGDLVVVDSPGIQNMIMQTLRQHHFSHNGLWIGLTDEEAEEKWKWTNGHALGYNNWASGEGDDFLSDCAHLRYSDGGKWHDSPCDILQFAYAYVCQYNLRPAPVTHPVTTPLPTTPTTRTTTPYKTSMTTTYTSSSLRTTAMTKSTTTTERSCGVFTCQMDCGILGYKVDQYGCPGCACQQ